MSISLSCCKYPSSDLIPVIWRENLLPLMELAHSLASGIRATVTDERGAPLREATVKVEKTNHGVSRNMAYFKIILVPSVYTLTVSCEGYDARTLDVLVERHSVTDVEIKLTKRDIERNATRHDDDRRKMTNIERLSGANRALSDLSAKYPRLATLRTVGRRTAKGSEIVCLEIGSDNTQKRTGRPAVVFTAGVQRAESVTSEVLLHLASFLLESYKTRSDVRVTNYLDNFTIYVAPDFSPDRNGSRDCAPLRSDWGSRFPLRDKLDDEAAVIANWFREVNAVLAVNLNSGSRHIEIPYGNAHGGTTRAEMYKSADEDSLRRLASVYADERAGKLTASSKCERNLNIGDNSVIHAGEGIGGKRTDPLLDYVYFNTSTLMMDVYVACCTDDPSSVVWRENKDSLLSCIDEIGRGVKGHVTNEDDEPIEDAVLSYDESPHMIKTGIMGSYFILLRPDSHNVTVAAPGYISQTKLISTSDARKSSNLMFKLVRDDDIMGMPRLVFVMMTGEFHSQSMYVEVAREGVEYVYIYIYNSISGMICFGVVLCGICVCAKCQSSKSSEKSRKGYAFSLLNDGTSFFDDDEKEIEIFRRPVDGRCL